MEGALKWRGGKSGQRYFQQREGRAGVVVVSLTRRAKKLTFRSLAVHHLVSWTTPSRSLDQRVYQDFLFKLYTLIVNEIDDEYPKINALAELTRLR